MVVPFKCPVCGKTTLISVKREQWFDYLNDEPAGFAFYDLPLTEVETIVTGFCAECQRKNFG